MPRLSSSAKSRGRRKRHRTVGHDGAEFAPGGAGEAELEDDGRLVRGIAAPAWRRRPEKTTGAPPIRTVAAEARRTTPARTVIATLRPAPRVRVRLPAKSVCTWREGPGQPQPELAAGAGGQRRPPLARSGAGAEALDHLDPRPGSGAPEASSSRPP